MKRKKRTEQLRPVGAEQWIFLAATVFLFFFAILEAQLHTYQRVLPHSILLRILLLLLICVLFYLGGALYAQRTNNTQILFRLIFFFFLLYLYLLLNVTLFEKGFGRDNLVGQEENTREYYLRYFVNLTPFRSIWEVYIKGLMKGYVSAYYVLLNFFGNICVFMPFSFFLPAIFPLQRRWYIFLPTLLCSVIAVELLQFAFMVGSCDVDDVILNVFGAALFYFILRLPPLSRLVSRLCGVARTKQNTEDHTNEAR